MPFNFPDLGAYKAGDTYSIVGACVLPEGTWTGTSELRGRDDRVLVGAWTVALGTPVDGATPVALTPIGDTSGWRPGACVIDMRFTDSSGEVLHSPTLAIQIIDPITQATQ